MPKCGAVTSVVALAAWLPSLPRAAPVSAAFQICRERLWAASLATSRRTLKPGRVSSSAVRSLASIRATSSRNSSLFIQTPHSSTVCHALHLHSQTQLRLIALLFFLGRHRFLIRRLEETNRLADSGLPKSPDIGFDHGADLGIAARWLRVAQLDDRLAALRHLDHPRHNPVGTLFDHAPGRQYRPCQPVAVAVALRCDLPVSLPELLQRGIGIGIVLTGRQYPHCGGRLPILAGRVQGQTKGGRTDAEAMCRDRRARRRLSRTRHGLQTVALLQGAAFKTAEIAAHLRAA